MEGGAHRTRGGAGPPIVAGLLILVSLVIGVVEGFVFAYRCGSSDVQAAPEAQTLLGDLCAFDDHSVIFPLLMIFAPPIVIAVGLAVGQARSWRWLAAGAAVAAALLVLGWRVGELPAS